MKSPLRIEFAWLKFTHIKCRTSYFQHVIVNCKMYDFEFNYLVLITDVLKLNIF